MSEWLFWLFEYLKHIFVMMYWVTVPGLLLAGLLNVRYRRPMLDGLVVSDLSQLEERRACYTLLCNERGGILDDLLVYRLGEIGRAHV